MGKGREGEWVKGERERGRGGRGRGREGAEGEGAKSKEIAYIRSRDLNGLCIYIVVALVINLLKKFTLGCTYYQGTYYSSCINE